jgi:hypothetical protein
MEMTAILAGLVATAGGLVVLVASGLRVAGAHRQGLRATGMRLADSLHIRWLAGVGRPLSTWAQARRPVWLFGMTAALGVLLIVATAIGTDRLSEEITAGGGIAVLDYPVASFVAAHRSGALTTVMRAVSSAGGPPILAAAAVVAGVLLTVLRRSRGPVPRRGAARFRDSERTASEQHEPQPGFHFRMSGRGGDREESGVWVHLWPSLADRRGRSAAAAAGEGPKARERGGAEGCDGQRGCEPAAQQLQLVEAAHRGYREQQHEAGQRGADQRDAAPGQRDGEQDQHAQAQDEGTRVAAVRCWTSGRPRARARA